MSLATPSTATRHGAAALRDLANRTTDRHVVVAFDKPVTDATRATLSAGGVTLLSYLADNTYFAALDRHRLNRPELDRAAHLTGALTIRTDWKLHAVLARGERPTWAIVTPPAIPGSPAANSEWIAAYILFHADVNNAEINGLLAAHNVVLRSRLHSINAVVVEMPLNVVDALASADPVQYIEPALPRMDDANDSNRARTEADVVQSSPYNLDGSGVSVLVYDGGTARSTHVDFGGRVHVRDASGTADHSTHVCGTIGGDGTASGGLWRGMAPGVTIESYGFETGGPLQAGFLYTDPGDIEADYTEAISIYGADVANNSIGTNTSPNGFPCDWEGDYGVTSSVIDSIVYGGLGTPFRIVWANGNERQGSQRCGATYHTTAPPACAKNHITVGALNSNDDSVTAFTSWGPTDDDRLKPDIAAPGCQSDGDGGVTSPTAGSDTEYSVFCGTSMAAPTVTGLAALLLQDYRAQFPGAADFRNSTLKALLAHNAEDIETPGPDYMTGYGSVRIQRTIDFMRTGQFLENAVDQSGVFGLVVNVPAGEPTLKVTAAWDDPPAAPNVLAALVNDLDLRVFDPSGVEHFPWTLGGLADPAAPAVRTQPDRVNNIEQVLVDAPSPGQWRIEIVGHNVPQGPQVFSLCVSTPFLGDCNTNGIADADDVAAGTSLDCNVNGVPDECEPDADCNSNGVRDICDIGAGTSADVNANNIADECEPDCNGNATPDDYDIAQGASGDCNANAVPDECDIAGLTSIDCDANSVPDECEPDCNGNAVTDACDLAAGTSPDCDANGVPDDCQPDCNENGIADSCDISAGTSADADSNGYPDECRLLYVDSNASGLNNGSSWTNAYADLQDALTFARVNPQIEEIWVAAGIYTPGPLGDEQATFQLINGVALYGGFAGGEAGLTQRDIAANETILSGDLGHDDVYGTGPWYVGWNRNTANSAHVVTGSGTDATARLDGFTIMAGSTGADGTPAGSADMFGGGMYNIAGSPTVANCTFKRNLAAFASGGAVYNFAANPTFTGCTFLENYVHLGMGAAIANVDASTVRIVDCSFTQNRSVNSGSGSEGAGAAIAHQSSGLLVVHNSSFDYNDAANFYAQGQYSGTYAGAIFQFGGDMKITNCSFVGNRSNAGGAIFTFGNAAIENCLFANNAAPLYNSSVGWGGIGGAVGCQSYAGTTVSIDGCTVVTNTAEDSGGVGGYGAAAVTVRDSILWNNTDNTGQIGQAQVSSASVSFCCIQNMLVPQPGENPPDPASFPGCTDSDPQFVDLNSDRRLLPTSPCIDAGAAAYDGEGKFDLAGLPRVLCSRVDMGAYETSTADYVCTNPTDPSTYGYWVYCMKGPGVPHPGPDCDPYDFDQDGDVDLADAGTIQALIPGALPGLNPPATISGAVSENSGSGGTIHIVARSSDLAYEYVAELAAPGPYEVSVGFAADYDLSGYRDVNSNGIYDEGEPVGASPSNPVSITSAGQVVTDVDLVLGIGRSISGRVADSNGYGEYNATLTLSGAASGSTTTSGTGDYAFTDVPPGICVVTPTKANRYFYPYDRTVDLSAGDAIAVDFVSHVFPAGDVDGEDTGTVLAVDPTNYNLTLDVGGSPVTLFVYVDTIYSGDASSLDQVQVGWTVMAQYYTSANLAVEIDAQQ